MHEFRINSTDTASELRFFNIAGDHFSVAFSSDQIKCQLDVYAYTDPHGLTNLFAWLASQNKPWQGAKSWESIDRNFKLSASCTPLGNVIFDTEMHEQDCAEEWRAQVQIKSEFGLPPDFAKKAQRLFLLCK